MGKKVETRRIMFGPRGEVHQGLSRNGKKRGQVWKMCWWNGYKPKCLWVMWYRVGRNPGWFSYCLFACLFLIVIADCKSFESSRKLYCEKKVSHLVLSPSLCSRSKRQIYLYSSEKIIFVESSLSKVTYISF